MYIYIELELYCEPAVTVPDWLVKSCAVEDVLAVNLKVPVVGVASLTTNDGVYAIADPPGPYAVISAVYRPAVLNVTEVPLEPLLGVPPNTVNDELVAFEVDQLIVDALPAVIDNGFQEGFEIVGGFCC